MKKYIVRFDHDEYVVDGSSTEEAYVVACEKHMSKMIPTFEAAVSDASDPYPLENFVVYRIPCRLQIDVMKIEEVLG